MKYQDTSTKNSHRGNEEVEIHFLFRIEKDPQKDDKNLSDSEFDWIHRLRTQIPMGLNTTDSDYM